uniref:Reverse transcriptase domain-containing protein n=1 Tax=Tanacetum cinerariifolium TaxID=118510 RepID=A0A6L2M039_TANCI|nr:hypothetical protein [Tanacetum cinerariifolium]
MPPKKTTTPMTDAAIKALIVQVVATALAEYNANKGNENGNDSHDSGSGRRTERATRECTYSNFLKCQPFNFKGTEGVVGLTQWFKKIEFVFHISNYTVAFQIKFATCTLLGNALMWLNSYVKTVGRDAAYEMSWKALKKMMTDKVGTDGSVMASKPKTMQDAIEIANDLMDQKIRTFAENKRKLYNDNQVQQQSPKMQNVARVYSVESSEKKEYDGTLPLCNKCKFHHNGPCTLKIQNHGNQAGGTEARRMLYALRGGETDQDLDNMEDGINA